MCPPHPCIPIRACVALLINNASALLTQASISTLAVLYGSVHSPRCKPILSCYRGSRDKPLIYSHPLHPSLERPSCLLTPSEVQVKAGLGKEICSTRHVGMGVEEYTSTGSKDSINLIFFKAVLSKWEMGAGEMALWSEGSVNKGTCGQSWQPKCHSPGLTWSKERTDSYKLSSVLHTHAMAQTRRHGAHTHMHAHWHTNSKMCSHKNWQRVKSGGLE